MRKSWIIGLLLVATSSMAVETAEVRVACVSKFLDNWNNYFWEMVAEDGSSRWRIVLDSKSKDLADGTYTSDDGKIVLSYSNGEIVGDSITPFNITGAELKLSHDAQGHEHVEALVWGNGVGTKVNEWTLLYDEPSSWPTMGGQVKLSDSDATLSDMRRSYNNFCFNGKAGGYEVFVKLNGFHTNPLVGSYSWQDASAIGTEVVYGGKHIPMVDVQLTVEEKTYSDTTGYVLKGSMTGVDKKEYQIEMAYHPRRSYVKKTVKVTGYEQVVSGKQMTVTLNTETDGAFTFIVKDSDWRLLHTYTMENGDLETEYTDANIRAFENTEYAEGMTFDIEAHVYTKEYVHYLLIYQEKMATGIENVNEDANEDANENEDENRKVVGKKMLIEGKIVIEQGGQRFDVMGHSIEPPK